jgi:hypothetical protein
MATLVAIDGGGEKHFLDILGGQPITANYNFKDITDLKTKGSHTYTFRLPSSKVNDAYFSSYFMVGSYNDGTNNNFNPFFKAEAYLLQDTIEVFTGYVQLVNVYLRKGNRYEYEVILFSNNVSFQDDLKGLNISDLDFTDYDHEPTIANVFNSFNTDSIDGGNVIYSLWDYGSGLATSLANTFFVENTGFLWDTPSINIDTLRPQVRLKNLITKLLNHKGYSYNSTFLDSALFNKIYVDANYNGGTKLTSSIPHAYYKIKAQNTGTQTFNYGDFITPLEATTELLDLDNNYDPATSILAVPYAGTYQYTMSFTIAASSGADLGANSPCNVGVYLKTGASTYILQTWAGSEFNIGAGTSQTIITQLPLDTTDYVLLVKTPTNEGTPQDVAISITTTYVQIDLLAADFTDGIVSFKRLFTGLKALDFFQSVIRKFNLVVIPNRDNPKQLYIEPYDEYMSAGSSLDWSEKIDYTKDVQIVPPSKYAGRSVLFKDTPSEDYVYQSFARSMPFTFGQYEEYLGNEFTEKSNTFTSVFSPTINFPIELAGFYTSPIIKPTGDGFENVGGIRLSFYHGKITLNDSLYYRLTTGIGNTIAYPIAPYFSAFSEKDFTTSSSVFTLNWGCTLSEPLVTWENVPLIGLASKYWLSYIRNNFNLNSRMLKANIRLTPRDIAELDFNNTIKINGDDYVINSIKGYPISSSGVCKVELLKTYGNFGEVVISQEAVTCQNTYGSLYSTANGSIFGSTTAATLDENCCTEYANAYFYNGICWNSPQDDTDPTGHGHGRAYTDAETNDVIGASNSYYFENGGTIRGANNSVVNGGRDIKIYGSSNTVKSRVKKIDITGDENTVNERVNDATIVGRGNVIVPATSDATTNLETVIYFNELSNINITGDYGKALNNNELIISKGDSTKEGTNQVAEHIISTTFTGGLREAWVGQKGFLATFPDGDTYNSELGANSFRLPDKTIVTLRVTIQATTGGATNTLNADYWSEENEYKILSGTAPIIISSTQISSTLTTAFVGSSVSIQATSNIPYVYNAYLLHFALDYRTLVNNSDFNIKTEYTTTPLTGTLISNVVPTDITGCVLWLDAANFNSIGFNSTEGNAQKVATWYDRSGGNNHVAQLSTTYMPNWYNGSTLRGRPYLDFDGSTSVLWNADADLLDLANGDNTFIAVFESDITTAESYGQVVVGINTSAGSQRAGITVNASGSGGAGADSVAYYNKSLGAFYCNIPSAGVTDPKIVVGRKNGIALDIIDENGDTDTYANGSSTTSGAYFTVGGRFTGTVDYNEFNGKIHELICYDDNISDADRDKLIYYLKNKWNIL